MMKIGHCDDGGADSIGKTYPHAHQQHEISLSSDLDFVGMWMKMQHCNDGGPYGIGKTYSHLHQQHEISPSSDLDIAGEWMTKMQHCDTGRAYGIGKTWDSAHGCEYPPQVCQNQRVGAEDPTDPGKLPKVYPRRLYPFVNI